MKFSHQVVAAIVAVPLAIAAFHVVSQTTTAIGGNLVVIDVDAKGEEQRRTEGRWVGFDFANGTTREIVITQLEDRLFADGFDQ